jgi:hypothetical protein
MEDRRFDALTKLVGRQVARRALVKGVAASALAAVFGRAVGDHVAEAAVLTRGGVKFRVKQMCTAAGSPCRTTSSPSRGCCYRCNSATKRCCEASGYACRSDSDCCDGRICRDPDTFDDEAVRGCFDAGELPYGAQCLDGGECASGACVTGVCVDCAEDGAMVCMEDSSGFRTCDHGRWVDRECAPGTICVPFQGSILCDWPPD